MTPRTLLAPVDLLHVLGVLGVSTLACAAMEPWLQPSNLVLTYIAGVAFNAYRRGQLVSLLTLVGSILVFDWIFVAPRWSLKPTDPHNYFTFAVMLAVGALIGHLAQRMRQQTALAEAHARRAQALQRMTEQLALARSRESVADLLVKEISHVLGRSAQVDWDDGLRLLSKPDAGEQLVLLEASGHVFGRVRVRAPCGGLDDGSQDLLAALAGQASTALERNLFARRSEEAAVRAESERLRNTLLSAISHDFRTPLTTIVGAATSLLEQQQQLESRAKQALLSSVLQEATRLHSQMSDLLDLTRLEEGAVKLRLEWCPADELLAAAAAEVEERLSPRRLVVPEVGDAVVWCDARLVHRSLVNLLDNSARHTPPGTQVTISLHCDEAHWSLSVRDDGPGLDAHTRSLAFSKFNHGRAERAARTGTGLGLAICAAVAAAHGGSIDIEPGPGLGVTMTFPQPAEDLARRLPE